MERWVQSKKKFLFNYEILKARLAIRDVFMQNAVKNIYENIGQVLSLIRMQLAAHSLTSVPSSNEAGNLVAQSIKDLRLMGNSFHPDDDLLAHDVDARGFCDALNLMYLGQWTSAGGNKISNTIEPELRLYLVKLLQDIVHTLHACNAEQLKMSVSANTIL